MDWKRLREERAAAEAERLAESYGGDYGATGDFGGTEPYSAPSQAEQSVFGGLGGSPPAMMPFDDPRPVSKRNVDPSQFDVSDQSIDQYTNSSFTRPKSLLDKVAETKFLDVGSMSFNPMRPLSLPVPEEKTIGQKTTEVLHGAEPYMRTAGAPLLTGGALAAHAVGRGPDQSVWETLGGGFKDLAAGPFAAMGAESGNGLSHQIRSLAGEAARGLSEEGVSGPERRTMLAGAVGGPLAEALSIPGEVLPGMINPAQAVGRGAARVAERIGIPNPTVGEAVAGLSRNAQELLGVARSTPPGENLFEAAVRRGAVNLPGKPQLTPDEANRISRLAYQVADGDMEKLGTAWAVAAERAREVATMEDKAVVSLMRDALKAEARTMRTGVSLKAEKVADKPAVDNLSTEEGLNLSLDAQRAILGEPDLATGKAATHAPRMEATEDAAARLARVEKGISSGGEVETVLKDAELLPREDVWRLTKELGGDAQRNKQKGLDFIRQHMESKALEPTKPPTTVAGRQEAKELELAKQADGIANGKPVADESPPAMTPEGVMGNGEATGTAQAGRQGQQVRPEQGQPAGQSGGRQANPVEPAPGLGNGQQVEAVFAQVEDSVLEGRSDRAATALKAAGLSWEDYSKWRKVREVPGKVDPSLLDETPPTATTPRTEPPAGRTSPPAPPGSRAPNSDSPTSTSPSARNDTGFAVNHIDKLQNASKRSGNDAGIKLAEDLREIVNEGETRAAPIVKQANEVTGVALKDKVSRKELSDLVVPKAWKDLGAGDLRVGRFQANVDANAAKMMIDPAEVALQSPASRSMADVYRNGMEQTGREAEALGVTTSSGEPFVAQVDRFTQQIDPSAAEWMKEGDPTFKKLKDQLSLIYPDAEVQSIGKALTSMASKHLDRQAAFEYERLLPMMPAAIMDDAGKLRPILRYNPLPTSISPKSPVAGLFKSQWMRLSGIKRLGQDAAEAVYASPDNIEGLLSSTKLGESLQAGGPEVVRAAEGALGALYHRPEAGYSGMNPSTWWINRSRSTFAQAFRAVTGRVVPAMNLSMQGMKSITQVFNEVPSMTGAMDFAKGLAKSVFKPGTAREEAEIAGALHDQFIISGQDVWDRHRPFESSIGSKVNRLPTEKLNDFVKDFEDTVAFTAGKFKAERMISKGSKLSDHVMMDEMNLPQSVQDVFRNPSAFDEAEKAEAVQSFARSVTGESQFHGKNATLKGQFENDPALKWIAPYQSYSINTFKRTIKDFERVWRTSGMGVDENAGYIKQVLQRINPFGAQKEPLRNSIQRLGTRLIGMEIGGDVVADISSGAQGKDPLRKDRSIAARALENLSYVGFLGPIHFVADMIGAHLLKDSDPELAKNMAAGRGGSRPVDLSNPVLEAGMKAAKHAAAGDIGQAAWDLTGGQMPIVSGIGRATGVMEPAGPKKSSDSATSSAAGTSSRVSGGGSSTYERLYGKQSKQTTYQRLYGGSKTQGGSTYERLYGKQKKPSTYERLYGK